MINARFLLVPSILIVSVFGIITGCKKDKGNKMPTITLTSKSVSDGTKLTAGDSAKIEFTVEASYALTSVVITNTIGTAIETFDSTTILTKKFSFPYKAISGVETYEITVSDNVGFITTSSFTVTTKPNIASVSNGTVTDQNGNSYKTVVIGTQTWMAENLRSITFNDNTTIPVISVDTTIASTYTYFNTSNHDSILRFGRLYNWYAVNSGKLCPLGWHVPSETEWITVTKYLMDNGYGYGYGGTGEKIAKSIASTSGWQTSTQVGEVGNNQASNNISGFSATAGGQKNEDGTFVSIGNIAYWWTATELNYEFAYYHSINSYSAVVDTVLNHKSVGLSVRCVKN
jgi:uncharacterized protein (TIGR02145 family)